MVIANTIFPAPSTAYLASIFLPLAGLTMLVAECAVYKRFSAQSLRWIVLATIVANVGSWIAGVVLTEMLPSGYVSQLTESGDRILARGPNWSLYVYLSYPLACLLSIVLELGLFYPLRKRLRIRRPVAAVTLANIASYTLLGLLVLVFGL